MARRNAWSSPAFGSDRAELAVGPHSGRAYSVPTTTGRREPQVSPARQFGTIRELPSGRYQARYWHLGEHVSAGTTFATKTEARRWLSSVETDLQRGDHIDPRAGSERLASTPPLARRPRPPSPHARDLRIAAQVDPQQLRDRSSGGAQLPERQVV